MKVEASLRTTPLSDAAATAAALEKAKVDVVSDAEVRRDPFVSLTLAATGTRSVTLASAVTIAFPRSPMVVAYSARNVHDYSAGRFRLGIGTQVKRHIERRFGTPWDAPGPRLRDYVLALRAIWQTWQTGAVLDHQGRYYSLTSMTPEFDLGPSEHDTIGIDIAAVNPYNLELAGELCDGVRLHPFNTPAYVRDVVWPRLSAGAARGARDTSELLVCGCGFVATGATAAEVEFAREQARARVAFYGSTLAYRPVLEHQGWGELQTELRELVRRERWDELTDRVPDEVLDAFCTAAPYTHLAARVADRWGGLVDMVQLPSPGLRDCDWEAFAVAVGDLAQVPRAASTTA